MHSPDKSMLLSNTTPLKAQFTDLAPQNLYSKDFSSDKNDYEHQTYKRSEETYHKLQ